jgi:hypothetical protein
VSTIRVSEGDKINVRHMGKTLEVVLVDIGRNRKGKARVGFHDPSGEFTVQRDGSPAVDSGRLSAAFLWCNQWEANVYFYDTFVRVRTEFHGEQVFGEAPRFIEAVEAAMESGRAAVAKWDKRAKREAMNALDRIPYDEFRAKHNIG